MKRYFKLFFVLLPFMSFGQDFGDSRFGVNLGATNYIMDTNFISSKSSTGYVIGFVSGFPINESLEVLTEINLNNHKVKLLGRESLLDTPRDLKYTLQNFNMSALLHYKFLEIQNFTFGVNLGPTGTILYGYTTNTSNESFLIDPLGIESTYLDIDKWSDKKSFNAFVSIGLSAQHKNFMANLRYYKGITDPYKNINLQSSFLTLEGKDSYWAFIITYFI